MAGKGSGGGKKRGTFTGTSGDDAIVGSSGNDTLVTDGSGNSIALSQVNAAGISADDFIFA